MRLTPPLLLVATAFCFLLPFATVSCDDGSVKWTAKMTGIELATGTVPHATDERGDSTDENYSEDVVALEGATAALALAAAIVGALVGFFVRGVAPAAGLLGGGVTASALAFLSLEGQAWLDEVDRHSGYWLALVFSSLAAVIGALLWARPGVTVARRAWIALALAAVGVLVLLAEFTVRVVGRVGSEYLYEVLTFVTWPLTIALPLGVAVSAVLLRTGRQALSAGLLLGLGAAAVLHSGFAIGGAWHEGESSARGIATVLLGSSLILLAGVLLARGTTPEAEQWASSASWLALFGATLLVIATFVPFNGGADGPAEAIVPAQDANLSSGLVPLGCGLIAILAVFVGRRGRQSLGAGALLGVGAASGLFFLELLFPLFGDGEDVSPAPGAVLGITAAALVMAGGAAALRDSDLAPLPPKQLSGASAS